MAQVSSSDIDAERALRLELWERLLEEGPGSVAPGRLRDLGLFGGAQGIWVDKARTAELVPDAAGLAVGVLHTGGSYADDLSDAALLFHYPRTNRGPSRDTGEVRALKWAGVYGVPVFAILPSSDGPRWRQVRLAWVEDSDDDGEVFLLGFGSEPTGPAIPEADEDPFFLTASQEQKKALHKVRPQQQAFAMKVFHRYGAACAVCGIRQPELIDAAHLVASSESGSYDARNGLPLCALHHRALDRRLWCVKPETIAIVARPQGPTLVELRVDRPSLAHLRALPHPAALQHIWRRWSGSTE